VQQKGEDDLSGTVLLVVGAEHVAEKMKAGMLQQLGRMSRLEEKKPMEQE
jgi:hypothetical protein